MSLMSMENIDISGIKPFASGFTGECYRINDEQILKLFFDFIDDGVIEREKMYARAAFIAGIPTPISFELVKYGDRAGVLYEALSGRTLSQLMLADADKTDFYTDIFVNLTKNIHETEADTNVFPDIRTLYKGYIEALDFLNDTQKSAVMSKIENLPDEHTLIHGDLHTNNIMYTNGEVFLIDMGDLAYGSKWFDIGHIYNIYCLGAENDSCGRVVKMKPEQALRVWNRFVDVYFDSPSGERRNEIIRKAEEFCLYKTMQVACILKGTEAAEQVKEIIRELLPRVLEE